MMTNIPDAAFDEDIFDAETSFQSRAEILEVMNELQEAITRRVALGRNPAGAFNDLADSQRPLVAYVLGSEHMARLGENTVYEWLTSFPVEHSFTSQDGPGRKWLGVAVEFQRSPRITCSWTRDLYDEVSLGLSQGDYITEIRATARGITQLFEQLMIDVTSPLRVGDGW